MSERLPPLNSLRAFEVAARRGGFAGAAEELHVTPAAVSHQVKTLESYLGIRLFKRLSRGLTLTEAGRELMPQLSRGFDHFARAVGSLKTGELSGKLTISAPPSLATLWLVPRLDSFLQTYPEIQVRVLATDRPPDLDAGEADLRIPYGLGNYPGFKSRLLMRETIFPVCAPSLLNHTPLRRFGDLRHHTLLEDIKVDVGEPTMTWKRWLRDAGVDSAPSGRRVEFSNSILLTEAAVRGQGVALGRLSLVRDHLATGRLMRPLKAARSADFAYYTVTTQAGAERRRVQAFLRWLDDQVAHDSMAEDGGA
jgi:LysR family glycine cleavage system transcriptional activator